MRHECILYERAKPVFVDVEPDTANIDAGLIEQAITVAPCDQLHQTRPEMSIPNLPVESWGTCGSRLSCSGQHKNAEAFGCSVPAG